MQRLNSVQEKMSCVFDTHVVQEPSGKRAYQPYRVVAGNTIRQLAMESGLETALASEKLDGTCVYVQEFCQKPWLWARHDRKPNKIADRRFRKFQGQRNAWELGGQVGPEPKFEWNLVVDIRDVPGGWIPAAGVHTEDRRPVPDENGHIPGWVPVDPKSRQHLWHLTAVELDASLAVILQPARPGSNSELEITLRPLSDFIGATLELIGTHVNANPYKIGSKEHPLHLLVRHGSIPCDPAPPLEYDALREWFTEDPQGVVEGVVWHCPNGRMFKAHRHHLGLKWPVGDTCLSKRSVRVAVDLREYEDELMENLQVIQLGRLHGKMFSTLQDLILSQDF